MLDPRKTLLIARYSTRYSVRSGIGLVFLLLSLTFGLLVAHTMLQPIEIAAQRVLTDQPNASPAEVRKHIAASLVKAAKPVVAWMVGDQGAAIGVDASPEAKAWAAFLMDERPATLSAIFLILLWGWPFLVAFGAFDLFAGDIGSRGLRYQLLRVDRGSIYCGRLLGSIATFAAVLVMLGVTVVGYIAIKLPLYGLFDMVVWALHGTAAILVVSLPYLALCGWISAAMSSSFGSLTIGSVVIGGVPLLAMIGRSSTEYAGYLIHLLPWGYQLHLLHPSWQHVGLAALGCLAMTALFLWLGYRTFTRRDL